MFFRTLDPPAPTSIISEEVGNRDTSHLSASETYLQVRQPVLTWFTRGLLRGAISSKQLQGQREMIRIWIPIVQWSNR